MKNGILFYNKADFDKMIEKFKSNKWLPKNIKNIDDYETVEDNECIYYFYQQFLLFIINNNHTLNKEILYRAYKNFETQSLKDITFDIYNSMLQMGNIDSINNGKFNFKTYYNLLLNNAPRGYIRDAILNIKDTRKKVITETSEKIFKLF